MAKFGGFPLPPNLSPSAQLQLPFSYSLPKLGDQQHSRDDTREINIPTGKLVFDTSQFLYSPGGAVRCLHFFGLLFHSHFAY